MRLYTQVDALVNQLGCVSRYNPVKELAGLPLILSERVEHHYKSMGWSLFHEIT